ncbi:hypothetical protein [Peribacillus butanolivorans]|uniref:hypothetical protein n=1 Tax=Peribacillus butanolivorans TaxID=421767 RepID=UPI00366BB96A
MTSELFVKGRNIDRQRMLKADTYQELMDKIDGRLERKYPASKVIWIREIQSIFRNWDLSTEEIESQLAEKLKFPIEKKAAWLERKYKSVRLSYQDFEEELWNITYQAIEYYELNNDIDTEFTLVETLELFWKNRMNSFIKSCLYTKKNSGWYFAAPLAEDFEQFWPDRSPGPEESYILRETVDDMLSDPELNELEKRLLAVIYDYPDGSLREWGKEIGISHPQTVKRLFGSVQRKLGKYKIV